MQIRILDHKRFLEPLRLPGYCAGKTVVAVKESEGGTSTFAIEMDEGRIATAPTQGAAEFTCPDRVWAAIASGSLCATDAVRLGLAAAENRRSCYTLDALGHGPSPFCHEYF
jgi:hypothetical protein